MVQVQVAAAHALMLLLTTIPAERLPLLEFLESALCALTVWAGASGCFTDHALFPRWSGYILASLELLHGTYRELGLSSIICLKITKVQSHHSLIANVWCHSDCFALRSIPTFHLHNACMQVLPAIILKCPCGLAFRTQLCQLLMNTIGDQPEVAGSALPLLPLLRLGDELAASICIGLRSILQLCASGELEKEFRNSLSSIEKVASDNCLVLTTVVPKHAISIISSYIICIAGDSGSR